MGFNMNGKLTIGQMAKLNSVPIKTLRYYDEIGLFKPYEVDAATGYRYYTLEQMKKLDLILYLKNIGIPLKEIQKNIQNNSLEQFINMLEKYKNKTEKKISALRQIQNQLNKKIHELSSLPVRRQFRLPVIKRLSARKVIQVNAPLQGVKEVEPLLRKIKKAINSALSIVIGNVGYIISREEKSNLFEGLFVTIEDERQIPVEWLHTLPAGEYAFFYVNADYAHIHLACQAFLNDLQKAGREAGGSFYIRSIVDAYLSNKREEWAKEIQILLKPLTVQ